MGMVQRLGRSIGSLSRDHMKWLVVSFPFSGQRQPIQSIVISMLGYFRDERGALPCTSAPAPSREKKGYSAIFSFSRYGMQSIIAFSLQPWLTG